MRAPGSPGHHMRGVGAPRAGLRTLSPTPSSRGERGIGMHRDLVAPQIPSLAIVRELLNALTDQPGLRLAQQTGRRVFFGGSSAAPQIFARAPGGPNSEDNLAVAPLAINARRLTGKVRGQAPGR